MCRNLIVVPLLGQRDLRLSLTSLSVTFSHRITRRYKFALDLCFFREPLQKPNAPEMSRFIRKNWSSASEASLTSSF